MTQIVCAEPAAYSLKAVLGLVEGGREWLRPDGHTHASHGHRVPTARNQFIVESGTYQSPGAAEPDGPPILNPRA
jgi:hypothetical protein